MRRKLKTPGHALKKFEHAGLVGRAEPKRVSEGFLRQEIVTAAPGPIRHRDVLVALEDQGRGGVPLAFVEIEHQSRASVKGGFGAGEVSESFAGQAPLDLIGTLLERRFGIVGFSKNY